MENSQKKDATGKLKELARDIEVCMMITGWNTAPFCAVPMTTKRIDASGNIWFLSLKNSEHNRNIAANDTVELLYSDPTKMEFLSISGKAKIHTDKKFIDELHDEEVDSWIDSEEEFIFNAIEVVPEKAYCWDTEANKYETLYHLGIATLTGGEKHEEDRED